MTAITRRDTVADNETDRSVERQQFNAPARQRRPRPTESASGNLSTGAPRRGSSRSLGAGDRVIIVFGAGHAYWLRHFVETTPGFELVEPNRYLIDSKK